jgi:hypothetical protein
MTMLNVFEATPAQVNFIKDLIEQKNVRHTGRAMIILANITAGKLDKAEASKVIDELKALPKVDKAAAYATGKSPIQELLNEVPKAKYAVPMDEVDLALTEKVNGDHIFVEIREYMNNVYIRRLHGAPGHFNRSRLSVADTQVLVNIIKKSPLEYTQKFGELYSCCGKCGAELTDQVSRDLKLGPTCRKEFGM